MHGWDLLNSILGRRDRRSSFDRFPAGYAKHPLCISNGFQHVSTDKGRKNRPARFARRIRGAWLVRTALLVSACLALAF